ncbi:MAG: hypothetical protein PVI66_13235 [Candidatus Aminicenantes bacterium]|jgi:hypothetical protein
MGTSKRLGDVDPFAWIRDTREDILVERVLKATSPRIGSDSKMAVEAEPFIHTHTDKPVEVTIAIKYIQGERVITVEVMKEGSPPAKINLKA